MAKDKNKKKALRLIEKDEGKLTKKDAKRIGKKSGFKRKKILKIDSTERAKKIIKKDKNDFTDKDATKVQKKTGLKINKIFKLNVKDDAAKAKAESKKASKDKGNPDKDPDLNIRDPFDFKKKMAKKGEYRDAIEDIDKKYEDNPYLNKYKGPQELKMSAEQRTKNYKFNTEGAGSQLNKDGVLVKDSEGNKFKKAKAPEFESGYNYSKLDKKFGDLRSNMGINDSTPAGKDRTKKTLSKFSSKYSGGALKIPNRGSTTLNSSGKAILKGLNV